jgi:cytoskeletal protein CcmA (bactofilin family)
MALWDRASTVQKESVANEFDGSKVDGAHGPVWHEETPLLSKPAERVPRDKSRESVIAADLTIEGKIEGAGHVRIAGRFKGDIHVEGNLTIEEGAQLAGEIRADTIIIAGELQGNIQAASRVELLESGMITGDLNAGSLTVAAGSRMRGRVEFGWDGRSAAPFETNNHNGSPR